MSKYSEYSKLRSVARKRAERLAASGLAELVTFPTVKELKAGGMSVSSATKQVQSYLEAPSRLREYRRIEEGQRPVFIQEGQQVSVAQKAQEKRERRKAQNREAARRYRERIRNLSKREKGYMKAARTLGLHITPANARAFGEYMDFRFAQGNDKVHYRIALYVEDFSSIMEKHKYTADEVMEDFQGFMLSRSLLIERSKALAGRKKQEIDSLFADFAGIKEPYIPGAKIDSKLLKALGIKKKK